MLEILHRYLAGQVAEHYNAIVGALIGVCIAEWRHAVGEVHKRFHAFYAASGCGDSG